MASHPTVSNENDLEQLAAWLRKFAPENILMPLQADSKRPIAPHKDNQWSWAAFDQAESSTDYGLLNKTFFVVDFDSDSLFGHFREEHADWFKPGSYALAKTAKGWHVIFMRSQYCDDVELTDQARSLEPTAVPLQYLDVHGEVPMDFKTICSTQTASVLVVAPSRNKTWMVAPWSLSVDVNDGLPASVPDELVQWILNNKKRPTKERIARNKEGTPSHPRFDGKWTIDMHEGLALAMAKQLVEGGTPLFPPDHDSVFHRRNGDQFYFKTGPHRKCPYRDEYHDHNNFAVIFCQDGNILYWCFGGTCQDTYNKLRLDGSLQPIGQWRATDDLQSAETHVKFNLKFCQRLTDSWDRLMSEKEGERDIERLSCIKQELMTYFNKFFVVVTSSKPEILELRYNGGGHIDQFVRRTIENTLRCYPSTFMRHVWFPSGGRRQVSRMVFQPDILRVAADEFNMFLGLKVERENDLPSIEIDHECIKPILELLHDVWANKNKEIYNYLLDWFAYPLQKRKKTGVCVIVIGRQGIGKGTIGHDLMGRMIYGENTNSRSGPYAQITDIDDIVGRFNSMSCCRMYINADECSSFGGAYKQNNKFKSIITANSRKMEEKGLEGVPVDDYVNILMTTNNDDPARIETSDRRFVVLDVPDEAAKSVEFFNSLHRDIEHGNVAVHFFKFLMERDLSNFAPQTGRPVTSSAKQMMALQIPLVAGFLQECVESAAITLGLGHIIPWRQGDCISSLDMFAAFMEWSRTTNNNTQMSSQSFGMRLSKSINMAKSRVSGGDHRGSAAYVLPTLEYVEEQLKAKNYWSD